MSRTPEELHEPIREHLRRATRRRMVADVPLGAFLSGGIDSSAVVAAMAEASARRSRRSRSASRARPSTSSHYARRSAQLFGTEHQEFVVRPDAIEMLPKVVRQYGEPFADPSAIPAFYLSELTRSKVTVALNGDGGDESFGGYTRYVANRLGARLDRLPLRAPQSPGCQRRPSRRRRSRERFEQGATTRWRGCRSDRRGATTGTSRGSIRRDAVSCTTTASPRP